MSEEEISPRPHSRGVRASDEDREQLIAELNEHTVAGRLETEELERRVQAAYTARTTGELDALRSDLPVSSHQVAVQHAERRRQLTRRMLQESGGSLGAFVVCTAIWARQRRHRRLLARLGAAGVRGQPGAQRLGAVRTGPRPRRGGGAARRAPPQATGSRPAPWGTAQRPPRRRPPLGLTASRSALDAGVDLVQQPAGVGEVEVLGQVALGLLTGGAVERHVESDQPRALGVAAVMRGLGLL